MRSLADLADRFSTDKRGHGYCPHYERHLGVGSAPRTILEIGIGSGASLRMWEQAYPGARVMGVDVDPECQWPDVECHLGSATDRRTYEGWLNEAGLLDVVIDDGSHLVDDVMATFVVLWPHVAVGGWYVIEDLRCALHPVFGGDQETGGAVGTLLRGQALDAVEGLVEMHVYEEIAFIRRLTAS